MCELTAPFPLALARTGTYGGHLELTAFARLKKRSIKVILPDYVYVIAGRDESPTPLEAEAQGQSKRDGVDDDEELESAGMLYLSYHIFEHYSSVRNLKGPHVGLPRVIEVSLRNPRIESDWHEAGGIYFKQH